ncbi:MAG: gamma-glutamyltransferase [Gemmatimonadota bacterium]|nr:gamma-glutamyltransferase [Gemmatimonadota bacterium]
MSEEPVSPSSGFEHWPVRWPFPFGGAAVEAERGMVATTDRYASRVGVDVLEEGGNAVDAAVAVSFALAVVNPEAGNVGGSGFMLVRTGGGATAALDFRSVAPSGATPDMFLDADGAVTDASELGHLAVAVPGSVRGLWDAHVRFGSMAWARLVEPAVALARGFVVRRRLVRSYEPHIVAALRRFPASADVFLPGGAVPCEGDELRQPDLVRTLERIRDAGPDGFYRGETADLLVDEMRRGGGLLTHEDLASYTSVWREPLRFRYRGHTIVSMPPSSSGGVTLAAMAQILSGWTLGDLAWHGARHVHLLAEAWKRAYADRNHYLADPDYTEIPLETLISAEYGAWRAASLSPEAATAAKEVTPGVEGFRARREGSHTTHVSIVDGEGGAVSLTTTLNTWYGSKVVAEGTGVLLNNDMDDFTAKPGVPNHFGLVQSEANAVAPGKRMLSTMTPTLVLDEGGRLVMVVGNPGGATIMTTIFQVISNVADHGMSLADAVAAPRVHHQHLPDRIHVEPGGLPAGVVEELRALGHEVVERDEMSGDVQAVWVRADGTLEGAADPRRGGVALGR